MIKETIGNCELYLSPCEDILEKIGAVDALVTDPPYEFKTAGGGKFRAARPMMDQIKSGGLDKGFDFQIINSLLYRSAVVFCHNDQVHKLSPYLCGSYSRNTLCFWEKTAPSPFCNKSYVPNIEIYFHAWNAGGHPVGDFHDKYRTVKTSGNGRSKYEHPTVKPSEVMDKIMRNVNGYSVIDPFAGTGSTGVAAVKAGKSFIGIEKNENYFWIMVERIYKAVNNKDFS